MIHFEAMLTLSAIGGTLALVLLIADRFLCNYGPCTIRVNEEEPFTIQGGGKLLDALYDQKIFIPSACGGQGTCGYCKVRVLEGGGPVLPTELPFLASDEQADGTRLACQIKIKQDIAIRVKEEFLHVQEFQATVARAQLITLDTREIVLALGGDAEIEFRPGQYIQIFVPGTGETTFRAYSIASPPSRKREVELLVRLIPSGLGSTYLHSIQPGDPVTFTGPYGEFIMDESTETELVCVGGGCGMAPMRSILRHLGETTPGRTCSLYFGARTAADAMYLDEFRRLQTEMPNLNVVYALSEPEDSSDWDGATGFIHESVRNHLSDSGKRQLFLCGPPPMIEATMTVLDEKGVPTEDSFYDKF
ncbi:MAG: 2Fe-2S iron-sulfur cluster binding domain-containing protein [Lentisphaeria bacterium]|nr:2Fe-2S iron-sulfur cluster binding domain-containing protein [Lentisphaeria bacterium]